MDWFNAVGGLADKYLDYRRVESLDAVNAQTARYKAEAERPAPKSEPLPSWAVPAMLAGAGLLVVVLLAR
jgi:hypothetical protein